MIDTNVILIIAGILTLVIIGFILVTGSNSSNTTISRHNTLGAHKLMGSSGPPFHIGTLPTCQKISSADIVGLDFFKYDVKNQKSLGKMSVKDSTVLLNGKEAVLITNSTGKNIQKMFLTLKSNDSPTNFWIYKPDEPKTSALYLDTGDNMPYAVDLPAGSSVVLDVVNASSETKISLTIVSVLVNPLG